MRLYKNISAFDYTVPERQRSKRGLKPWSHLGSLMGFGVSDFLHGLSVDTTSFQGTCGYI